MDYAGEYCVTTMDFRNNPEGTPPTVDDWFVGARELWVDMTDKLSNQLVLQTITIDGTTASVTGSGQQAGTALPGNCALRVMKQVGIGRPGSFNLPGLLEAAVTSGGLIETAAFAGWVSDLSAALTAYESYGMQLVVGESEKIVFSLAPSARIGTFRNRMFGR